MLLQILAVALLLFFVIIAVLAFIEPGPLDRRSRNRHTADQGTPPAYQQQN